MFRSLRTVAVVGAAVTAAVTVAFAIVPATAPVSASPTPAPTITTFTPALAPVGSPVTINGSDLSGATEVDFDYAVAAPITTDTGSQITTTVPLGDDDGPLTVTTPGGTATSPSVFTLEGFYIVTDTLPEATPRTPYNVQLEATGGKVPYRWTRVGALPRGLTLTRSGRLFGAPELRPNAPNAYSFIVHVRDSTKHGHLVATETLSLTVSSLNSVARRS
jgi:hypothetical protein